MKIILVGATGTIGKAVADLLHEKGHEVISATRSTQPALNLDEPPSIDAFYTGIGEVDAIICTSGNAAFAPVDGLTDEQLALSINSKLVGQINLVRKGLTNLRAGGVFVLTGGMLAYTPWPATAAVAMVNAGVEGFVRATALDLKDNRRIVVVHPPLVKETALYMNMDGDPWPSAAAVAEAYVTALESELNGQPVFVKGYDPTS